MYSESETAINIYTHDVNTRQKMNILLNVTSIDIGVQWCFEFGLKFIARRRVGKIEVFELLTLTQ